MKSKKHEDIIPFANKKAKSTINVFQLDIFIKDKEILEKVRLSLIETFVDGVQCGGMDQELFQSSLEYDFME